MKVQGRFTAALLAVAMIFCVQAAGVYAADDIVTVRYKDATGYESPGYDKMESFGLQGSRFDTEAAVSIAMSVYQPGGGTEMAVAERTSMIMVMEGELTITRDEGDIVLGQYDSVYLPAGVKRGIINNGKSEAKTLYMSNPATEGVPLTEPSVVRFKDAKSYKAGGHFKMEAYGLQGSRFKTAADINLGLSVFHPKGGTNVENGTRESLYMVAEGELTIQRPEGEGNIILNQYDSVYIPAGVSRGIMNNSGKDVKMLVFSPGVAGITPIAGADADAPAMEKIPFKGDDVTEAKTLFGLWESAFMGKKVVMQFKNDGTLAMAASKETLTSAPNYTGWYWFEDGVMNFTDSMCSTVGTYKAKIQKGAVALEVIEDECGDGRISDLTVGFKFIED